MRTTTPRARVLPGLATVVAAALFAAGAHADGRFGLVGAANFSQIERNSATDRVTLTLGSETFQSVRTEDFAPGWELGGTFEWPRNGGARLETGARYVVESSAMGIETTSRGFRGDEQTQTRLEFAMIPLQLMIAPFPTRGLRISAGANGAYLLRATSQLTATMTGPLAATTGLNYANIFETLPAGEWHETTSAYRRWNAELSAGAGWEFLGERRSLRFDVRYAHGVVDISNADIDDRTRRVSMSVTALY